VKTVLLAGGQGTRLAEETEVRPKPLVEIGGKPILWHIMKQYRFHGFREFVVAMGYKAEMIKRYFVEAASIAGNLTVDLGTRLVTRHEESREDWLVHLVDTGEQTLTGGRLKRLESWLCDSGTFMLTYGDGVADVDIRQLVQFHREQGRLATMTAVRQPARFGAIVFEGNVVKEFKEKPQMSESWINGGFLVFEPEVFAYLQGDQDSLESTVLERLSAAGQLTVYHHEGFWQCMDTLRDKRYLESLWDTGRAPWRLCA
jgi:glucose-1-phosphate cytidylyltransferase